MSGWTSPSPVRGLRPRLDRRRVLESVLLSGLSGSLLSCTPQPEPLPPDALVVQGLNDKQGRAFRIALTTPASLAIQCPSTTDPTEILSGQSPLASEHTLVLRGFLADTTYTCQPTLTTADNASQSLPDVQFKTEPLPSDLEVPTLIVPGDPETVGYTLFNYAILGPFMNFYATALVIIDWKGQVRWYDDEQGGADVDAHYRPGGRILFGGATPPMQTAPTLLTLDRGMLFVATSEGLSPYEDEGSYHHDVDVTVTGDHLLAMTHEYVDDWQGFVLREIDLNTNTLSWSWSSIEQGVGSGVLPPGDSNTNPDPYHANAVEDLEENGETYIYVSLERLDHILKIRKSSKQVIWKLGWDTDFTLLEADGTPAQPHRWFFGQHDLHVRREADGLHLTLYDNGTKRADHGGTNYTRVLELLVDEGKRTARILFEYTETGWYEPLWGGYDRFADGSGLIARAHCAVCGTSPGSRSTLMQLSAEGEVTWRVEFASADSFLYRAERIEPGTMFNLELSPGLDREALYPQD